MRVDRRAASTSFPPRTRRVVAVPDVARDRDGRVAQLPRAWRRGGRTSSARRAMSTSATPAISQASQKIVERREPLSASASGPARPRSSRSRAWKTNASASVNALLGTPCEQPVVDRRQREDLLDVVAQLVDGDVVALVVHPVLARRACAGAPCRRAARRPARGRRRATGRRRCGRRASAPCSGVKPRSRAGAGCRPRTPPASGSACGSAASSSASACCRARLEAGVPDVERLERPAEPLLDERPPPAATSGEARTGRAAPRTCASGISRSTSKRRSMRVGFVGRVRVGRARGAEDREEALRSACRARGRRLGARGAPAGARRPGRREPAPRS